jgi:DNA-directed RNA polymerase specialized sigma24 family protein
MRSASVAALVEKAKDGSGEAWDELVARFGGMIAATGRRYRLTAADVAELQQTTWLRLVEVLHCIEHPEAVGRWLAATARRESLQLLERASGPAPRSTTCWPTRPAATWESHCTLALVPLGTQEGKVKERVMK